MVAIVACSLPGAKGSKYPVRMWCEAERAHTKPTTKKVPGGQVFTYGGTVILAKAQKGRELTRLCQKYFWQTKLAGPGDPYARIFSNLVAMHGNGTSSVPGFGWDNAGKTRRDTENLEAFSCCWTVCLIKFYGRFIWSEMRRGQAGWYRIEH